MNPDSLLSLVDRLRDRKILVIGDFLLDEFVFGEISRVSREAPVLILKYQETLTLPGGGANTVANLFSLGAHPIPVGFVGDDVWADALFDAWPDSLDRRHVFREAEFQTTRKCRILAGSFHSYRQQVVRMDFENSHPLASGHQDRIIECLKAAVPECDAVIVSDYSLGNLTPRIWSQLLDFCRAARRTVVVDSRDRPHSFRGATSATPNITEVEASTGLKIPPGKLPEVASEVRRKWDLQALLVTRGKLGMTLVENDRVTDIPIYGGDQVVDVTGAGDTVIATYTAALAAGGSFLEASHLANFAGGIVVMKRGTATVSQAELRKAIMNSPGQNAP